MPANDTARMRELLNNALQPTVLDKVFTLAPSAGVSTSYAASTLR